MAFWEVRGMEIREVIRRWKAGESARSIAQASGLARNTVSKYRRLAVAAGVSQGGEPPSEQIHVALVVSVPRCVLHYAAVLKPIERRWRRW